MDWRRRQLALIAAASFVAAACGDGAARDVGVQDTRAAGRSAPPVASSSAVSDSFTSASRDSNGSAKIAPVPTATRPTILFIGTSLTAGLGLDLAQAYPAVVGEMLDSAGHPVHIVNAGVSGETSAGALRRLDWVLRTPADVILVETGANDGLRGLDVPALKQNLEAIIDRIRATNPRARLILAQMEAPPNLGARYTNEFRALFPAVAKEKRVELLPFLLDGVAGNPALNQDDGIHPNVRGARIVAANVTRALLKRSPP
jgi:acyl-CoA thioesterase-1